MLLGDDTLVDLWFDCLLITCSCQSGKRAKDWNDFPAPLSRIRLNVSRSLAASFDLWPGTRPASGRVANIATADGAVARTACPPFETAENSKSELIWLHRDTDYSQGDYTGLWDASRPMCACLCLSRLCLCVRATVRASVQCPPDRNSCTRHSSPSMNAKTYNSPRLGSGLILCAAHSVGKCRH